MEYYVYMVKCSDDTIYTGITNNLEKRVLDHNQSKTGAKYTRSRRPVELVYSEICVDKNTAQKREYAIKQLTRDQKIELVKTRN